MKIDRLLITGVFLLGFMPGCTKQLAYNLPEWKVGDWAEYEVQSEQYGPRTIRYAITGTDTLHNEPYYWLEMTATMRGSQIVNKMLVPYGYRGVAERMIVKFADQDAIEMPPGDELSWYPSDENRPYVYLEEEIDDGRLKDTTLVLSAGEFACISAKVYDIRHNKVGIVVGDSIENRMVSDTTEVQVWVADSIPVIGVAVLKSEREEMKLTAFGHDAKTAVTGEVKPLESVVFE